MVLVLFTLFTCVVLLVLFLLSTTCVTVGTVSVLTEMEGLQGINYSFVWKTIFWSGECQGSLCLKSWMNPVHSTAAWGRDIMESAQIISFTRWTASVTVRQLVNRKLKKDQFITVGDWVAQLVECRTQDPKTGGLNLTCVRNTRMSESKCCADSLSVCPTPHA